jgi:DNA-directed RNA polymerase specialized sigma24 family protein
MFQMLTEKQLGGYPNEYEAAKAAQDGNSEAWMLLWKHYKPMLMSRICRVRGFSNEELESEAVALFAYKLKLFDRGKVTKPGGYSLHSWLFLGAINLNNRLIRQRKREIHLYNEQVSAVHGGGGGIFPILYTMRESVLWKRMKKSLSARRRRFFKTR